MKVNYSSTAFFFEQGSVALRSGGYNLSIGDTNFYDTEYKKIVASLAHEAASSDLLHYTSTGGRLLLRDIILEKYSSDKFSFTSENVMVCNGGKQAIFNAMFSILSKDDEVIVIKPYWETYLNIASIIGASPIFLNTENCRFEILLDDIKTLITSKTKLIIINNPNNPTGLLSNEHLLIDVLRFANNLGIYVLLDEVYLSPRRAVSCSILFSEAAVKYRNTLIVVNSLSKTFALSGLRLGFLLAPRDIINSACGIQSNISSCVSTISQHIASKLLTEYSDYSEYIEHELENKRKIALNLLHNWIAAAPQMGPYVFLKSKIKSNLLFHQLLKESVAIMPGCAFGLDNYFRISLTNNDQKTSDALVIIKRNLEFLDGIKNG